MRSWQAWLIFLVGPVIGVVLGAVVAIGVIANAEFFRRPLFAPEEPQVVEYLTYQRPLWAYSWPRVSDPSGQYIYIDHEANMILTLIGGTLPRPKTRSSRSVTFDDGRVVHRWPNSVVIVDADGTATVHPAQQGWAEQLSADLRRQTLSDDVVQFLRDWMEAQRNDEAKTSASGSGRSH